MGDKAKMVLVRATTRGQLPDLTWKDENSAPFQVPENMVSKRWMKPLSDDEAKAAKNAAKAKSADAGDASTEAEINAQVAELTEANEAAAADLVAAEEKITALEADNEKLKAEVTQLAADLESATKPKETPKTDAPTGADAKSGGSGKTG